MVGNQSFGITTFNPPVPSVDLPKFDDLPDPPDVYISPAPMPGTGLMPEIMPQTYSAPAPTYSTPPPASERFVANCTFKNKSISIEINQGNHVNAFIAVDKKPLSLPMSNRHLTKTGWGLDTSSMKLIHQLYGMSLHNIARNIPVPYS